MGNLRLVLNVDVLPGNQTAGKYSRSGLWEYLDSLEESKKPTFVRGDSGYGNEGLMGGCESRGVKYLFKLRKSRYVKVLINQLLTRDDWSCAGQDWEGVESRLYLSGWSRSRRVIVLRRHIRTIKSTPPFAKEDYLFDIGESKRDIYEYAVLVTDLDDELLTIAVHYRDRADAENTSDEMKNQWGWAGFTTQDITRCRVMARITALCYNWRSIFIRLVMPHKHYEARTSRSLFLKGPGRLIRHGRNLFLKLTSIHGHYKKIRHLMTQVNRILQWISENAEQLKEFGLYRMILSIAFQYFLENRPLKVPQEFVLQ